MPSIIPAAGCCHQEGSIKAKVIPVGNRLPCRSIACHDLRRIAAGFPGNKSIEGIGELQRIRISIHQIIHADPPGRPACIVIKIAVMLAFQQIC